MTTSITSPGRPQQDFDRWLPKNANVRLGIRADRLHADLIAVDDVTRAESGTHVLASFGVADGRAGVVR